MKKLLSSLLVLAMLLSGCASGDNKEAKGPTFDEEVDVLVVGAGGSGMVAAIEAKQAGAENVLVIEKQDDLKGVTYLCEGILSGYETKLAKKYDVHYTADDMYNQIIETSYGSVDPELARITAEECGPLIDWLADEIGVPFVDIVDQQDFYSPMRILHYVDGKGAGYKEPFTNKLKELNIELRFNNKAFELIGNEAHNEVIGAKVETPEGTKNIKADAVVLCTGGYANNTELIQRLSPKNEIMVANREGGATGDAMIMASEFGALLHAQDDVKFSMGDYYGSPFSLRGTILVGQNGKRFRDEKGHYEIGNLVTLRNRMNLDQVDYIWNIVDANGIKNFEKTKEKNEHLLVANTVAELAELMEIEPAVLEETFAKWNDACDKGYDLEFNRNPKTFAKLDTAPFYALKTSPKVGMTYGGVVRNVKGEVIKVNGDIIPGLYVGGEAAVGATANGWTCSHALTWGRIAGRNAAAYSLSK